jgi:hypothetical protein
MKKLLEIFGFGRASRKRSEPPRIAEPFAMMSDRTAESICGNFELQGEARTHLSGDPRPHKFVDRLIQAGLHGEATRFLAYGLPEREAVWWATLCVRSVPACWSDEIAKEALAAGEAWVKEPGESTRNRASAIAKRHKFELPTAPAAWVATAAAWTAGGQPAPDKTASAPPERLTAHAVAGAIMLAAVVEPSRATELYQRFLETGVKIAQGKIRVSA